MTDTVSTVGLLALITLILTMVYGWVMNVVTLINGGYEATSTVVMGFVGIIIPIVGPIVYFVAG